MLELAVVFHFENINFFEKAEIAVMVGGFVNWMYELPFVGKFLGFSFIWVVTYYFFFSYFIN